MSTSAYLNFDLLILRSSGGYAARVISSPVGEATCEFQLPFTEDVLAPFFDVAGRKTRQGRTPRQQTTVEAPIDVKLLGQQLYETVFASEVGSGSPPLTNKLPLPINCSSAIHRFLCQSGEAN